ncbi:thiamine pyrophosphate-dependent enzyme [Streptacidiphilus jiangxiensis]|uniref:Sulfopyruvate decarboxylase subunit beta n=1 Tax=Streptacidiphilus jiangxiensis TaxID=235985 RepID=A0A1H7XM44_STRJI|nr:thiamine pyrophosphate-dependent enzyme [Streptacidiphilus jiangxiensis]SEM34745.1 sulfopyruvate decarboxylase subunit beta [Streptacidiphilus jiangxiensis]
MNKTAAVQRVIDVFTDEPIVFTTGYSCRIANHIADRANHFYMTGSMGLAASFGIGVALGTGRTAVVVDGDGSLTMNPVGLLVAGSLPELPLIHVVLDDGEYASTGGQRVPSARVDLGSWARDAGYRRSLFAVEADEFEAILRAEAADCRGPVFIHCLLRGEDDPVPGRISVDLADHALAFASHIAS